MTTPIPGSRGKGYEAFRRKTLAEFELIADRAAALRVLGPFLEAAAYHGTIGIRAYVVVRPIEARIRAAAGGLVSLPVSCSIEGADAAAREIGRYLKKHPEADRSALSDLAVGFGREVARVRREKEAARRAAELEAMPTAREERESRA